jgi:hypothetical protein
MITIQPGSAIHSPDHGSGLVMGVSRSWGPTQVWTTAHIYFQRYGDIAPYLVEFEDLKEIHS